MGQAGPIALGNKAKKLAGYGNHVEQVRATTGSRNGSMR